MSRRAITTLMLPIGIAACGDAPTAAEPAALAAEAAPSALALVGDARMLDLSAAVADARSRLLPALGGGGAAAELQAALLRLDESLAAEDAAQVLQASAAVDAALSVLAAGEGAAIAAELDAVRLTLTEVRTSARESGPLLQE